MVFGVFFCSLVNKTEISINGNESVSWENVCVCVKKIQSVILLYLMDLFIFCVSLIPSNLQWCYLQRKTRALIFYRNPNSNQLGINHHFYGWNSFEWQEVCLVCFWIMVCVLMYHRSSSSHSSNNKNHMQQKFYKLITCGLGKRQS